jgi:hypothetical protein
LINLFLIDQKVFNIKHKLFLGPHPIKKREDTEANYWGGAKTVAIEKEKTTKSKKKINQRTNKKKTTSIPKRKANAEQAEEVHSTSSESISITPPALKKAKRNDQKKK